MVVSLRLNLGPVGFVCRASVLLQVRSRVWFSSADADFTVGPVDSCVVDSALSVLPFGLVSPYVRTQVEDAETAYKCLGLHHSRLDGRLLNVERTSGGGKVCVFRLHGGRHGRIPRQPRRLTTVCGEIMYMALCTHVCTGPMPPIFVGLSVFYSDGIVGAKEVHTYIIRQTE